MLAAATHVHNRAKLDKPGEGTQPESGVAPQQSLICHPLMHNLLLAC